MDRLDWSRKTVHAVMLLYNYYHRKQYPNLEVLGFYPFCQLAVILKPALLAHLKFMKISNHKELDDLENQLSLVEKTIMKACDISRVLDTSREAPNTEGWPVIKVAVFLVDSKKENCVLQFSSITQGIWSLIEKDIEVSDQSAESAFQAKLADKKRRMIQKPSRTKSNINLACFQQLAYSAVKEAIGITQIDLTILEEHVVYSLSKEKEAAYFYIMQSTQSVDDAIQVPIKDVIDSLQGPLFKKNYGRWEVTQVVEYFHVLPYGVILSEWMHRLKSPSKSAIYKIQDSSHGNGGIPKDWNSKTIATYIESANVMHTNGLSSSYLQCNEIPHTSQLDITQEVITCAASANDLHGQARGFENKFEPMDLTTRTVKITHGNKICHNISSEQNGTSNLQIVASESNSKHLEKIQITIDASKEKMLSQAALEVLMRRRDNLSLQLRNIQDDIAECEGKIQTILNGSDDNFTLKIESLIEGCNDVFLSGDTREKAHQLSEDQLSLQYNKRKRLTEAIITIRNPCHELDAVCSLNNWVLPTYHICPVEGGFRANITVKGTDFDHSNDGDLLSNPREARESAAAKMLVKLQSMVGSS